MSRSYGHYRQQRNLQGQRLSIQCLQTTTNGFVFGHAAASFMATCEHRLSFLVRRPEEIPIEYRPFCS